MMTSLKDLDKNTSYNNDFYKVRFVVESRAGRHTVYEFIKADSEEEAISKAEKRHHFGKNFRIVNK